jgi:DNA-binding transcriptional LysR family regulator
VSLSALDLNLLLVLDTVLRERSVAGAARRLHVTPSAVSNSLAKLRAALNDPLVTRQGRGIVPTPRALELGPALTRAMAELEAAVTRKPFDAANCSRTFTLAMADALQVAWLPRIAALMTKQLPQATLRVVGIDSLLSLGDLASSEVDAHVGVRATGSGIRSETLYDEPTLLVMRQRHPLGRAKLTPQRLAELRHVAVELAPGRGFRDPIAAVYARAGVPRRVAMSVSSFGAAAAIVAGTEWVTTLPRSLFAAQGARWGLRAATGALPVHHLTMALCWHERTHADPAAVAFRALLATALRKIS